MRGREGEREGGRELIKVATTLPWVKYSCFKINFMIKSKLELKQHEKVLPRVTKTIWQEERERARERESENEKERKGEKYTHTHI